MPQEVPMTIRNSALLNRPDQKLVLDYYVSFGNTAMAAYGRSESVSGFTLYFPLLDLRGRSHDQEDNDRAIRSL